MGGQIRVIIREEDGTVHKHSRWTNSLPCFVKNPKFLSEDKEYIKMYIEGYKTSGYKSDVEFLSPNTEYGMVILDFKDKWVASMNGYCSFDNYELAGLLLDARNVVDNDGQIDKNKAAEVLKAEYNDFHSGHELYNSGLLSFVKEQYYSDRTKSVVEVPIKEFNEKEIKKLYNKRHSKISKLFKSNKSVEFERIIGLINYEKIGWSLSEYSETIEGNLSFLKDVLSHSFSLTTDDINDWQEYLNERYQDQEDEILDANIIKTTIRELTINKIV